jgi:hypothetical protein
MSSEARPLSASPDSPRPGTLSRRIGYGIAILVNLVLLVLVNGVPGWRAVRFLTEDTADVLVLIDLSLIVGILANLANVVFDRRSVRAVGEIVSSAVTLAMLVQLWNVFPFDFSDPAVDWALVARTVIGFAIAGCVLSIIVQAVVLIRIAMRRAGRLQNGHWTRDGGMVRSSTPVGERPAGGGA